MESRKLCVIIVLALVVGWGAKSIIDQSRFENTKKAGEEIVEALLRYKERMRFYPNSLSELTVSGYLKEITHPQIGSEEWSYDTYYDATVFILEAVSEDPTEVDLWFDSSEGHWASDTK